MLEGLFPTHVKSVPNLAALNLQTELAGPIYLQKNL